MRCSLLVSVFTVLVSVGAYADWNKGLEAYARKDYTTALREFQGVIETTKDHAGSHYYIGRCYRDLGRGAEALEAFREANRLAPTDPRYALSYGTELTNGNKAAEAVSVLEKVKMDGLNGAQRAAILTAQARANVGAGNYRSAIEQARQVTQLNANDGHAWGILGLAYSNDGRFSDAFGAFHRAWDLTGDVTYGKNAVTAGINAARTARTKAQKDQMFRDTASVATALAEKKGGAEGNLLAGEALLGADQYDEALDWFNRSGLDSALVNYYKGQCYVGKKDAARAERFLRDALLKQPDSGLRRNIYNSLGFVLDAQKLYDKAAQAYQEIGETAKVSEMREKAQKAEQNKKADEEQRRYEELQRLQKEFKELSGGGGPAPTPTPKQ